MAVEETITNGWDCVPELGNAVTEIEELKQFTYEIKNCVRLTDLGAMVEDMTYLLERALEELQQIDTEVEYKTVEEDEEK